MIKILLGNPSPLEGYEDSHGHTRIRPMSEATTVRATIPWQATPLEAVLVVGKMLESMMVPGSSPTWVWSDDAAVQQMLAAEYGLTESNPIPEEIS